MKAWGTVSILTILCVAAALIGPPRYVPTQVDGAGLERAEAYVSAHMDALPAGWTWQEHDFDGGVMRWGLAPASAPTSAPRGTIILVPGFRGYIEAYAPWLDYWHKDGFTVLAVDLPGQGASTRRADNPEKPWTGNFSEYGDLLTAFIRARLPETEGPVILAAESFGGHVALRAAVEQTLEVDGLALIVPGLEFNTRGTSPDVMHRFTAAATALGFGSRYAPTQTVWVPGWDVRPAEAVCGLREDRAYLQEGVFSLQPEYRVGGLTNEWAHGFERSGRQMEETDFLSSVDIPTLMILAEHDKVIHNERNEVACEQRMSTCETTVIRDAGHCMLFEPDDIEQDMLRQVADFAVKD